MFEQILEKIRSYDTIIIHRHNRPDGDAIGSQVGMKHIIRENFPEKTVYAVGDSSGYLSFVEDSATDTIEDGVYENALAIILDCGSPQLISDDRYKLAAATARIDHHIFTEKFTDTEVIESDFESCCGMIAEFARESGLRLNRIAATALFTGLVTDSGRFRYDNTNSRTFAIASYLFAHGIDTSAIYRNLYSDTYENKKIKAQFTLKIQFTQNNVAYIYTTKDELASLGLDTFTVSRGMVGTMAEIKGVGIWVNFTETDCGVLCEIRSADLNINPIAVKYGGGGHAKASGATVPDKDTAMAMLNDLNDMIGAIK